MVLLQECWGVTCCSGWLCDCQDFMILQDPDDEERAFHLEELHVVTFFDANPSVIQGTRKNTRFKIWELEKRRGGGYHSTVERRNLKQPPAIFLKTLQIMGYTISTGDRWISEPYHWYHGVTHRKQSHPWRKSPLWMTTWSGVARDMCFFPAVYHAGKWLGTWWTPTPPKKKHLKNQKLSFYQLLTVIIDVFPTIFQGFFWGKTSDFFFSRSGSFPRITAAVWGTQMRCLHFLELIAGGWMWWNTKALSLLWTLKCCQFHRRILWFWWKKAIGFFEWYGMISMIFVWNYTSRVGANRIFWIQNIESHIYLQAFSSSWSILSDPTFLYLKKNIRVFFYIKRIPGLQSLFSTYSGFFKASRCRALLEEWAGWRGVTLSPSKNSRCPHQKGMFLKSTEGGDILVVRAGSDFSEDWRKEFSIERNCLRRVGFVLDLEFFGKATTLRFQAIHEMLDWFFKVVAFTLSEWRIFDAFSMANDFMIQLPFLLRFDIWEFCVSCSQQVNLDSKFQFWVLQGILKRLDFVTFLLSWKVEMWKHSWKAGVRLYNTRETVLNLECLILLVLFEYLSIFHLFAVSNITLNWWK